MKSPNSTIAWYDDNAEFYQRQALRHIPVAQFNDFMRFLPEKTQVLDIGCGTGRDTAELAKRGLDVVGLDLSSGMINLAKKTHPHLKFIQGNFLDLPFADNSFIGVWGLAALVHLESVAAAKKALAEFQRVLKPGGILFLRVKANLKNNKFETVKDLQGAGERFFQYFTQAELKKYLQAAGFSLLKMQQYPERQIQRYSQPVEWIDCLGKTN